MPSPDMTTDRGPSGRPWLAWLRVFGWVLGQVLLGADPAVGADGTSVLGGDEGAGYFRERVEPLLRTRCFECHSHGAGKMKGGLSLDSRSGWVEGGESGPALVPGKPEESRLIRAVRRESSKTAMPPKDPLKPEEVMVLEDWVRRGAPDPRVAPVAADGGWWAVEPLLRRAVPGDGSGHPIDAWLTDAGLPPGPVLSGKEGRVRLARRLAVDLHGLVPSPEEAAGIADAEGTESEVVAREVDRLLASPRYGERWARHWLDVVHFAETHGHDQDRPRESAWPYREYVIGSLNADKPYARFVQEQVAADALFPDEPGLTPALGFLAAGPWDESSLRDIREDVIDREIGRYLDRDDIVGNVMATFASVTAQCARCHDHKFDPIPQRDYYALQAVFAGTEKAERFYDLDPAVHTRRMGWMRLQVALDRKDLDGIEKQLTPALRAEQQEWETTVRTRRVNWETLPPEQWFAAVPAGFDARSKEDPAGLAGVSGAPDAKAGLRRLEDASLLAFGDSPATNVYVVQSRVARGGVTAFQLELLPDPSLPARGPGRAENGNLHLTGFEVWVLTSGAKEWMAVGLANASASFNQDGWDIAKAFDSDRITGWGIHPEEGKAHAAAFELAKPGALTEGDLVRVVLRQEHGRQHTIGRFRLSTTTDAPPIRAAGQPEAVLRALALAPERRSSEERLAVLGAFLQGRVARELAALPEPRRVFAGASVFPANGGQKPLGRPREVRVLRRGEIQKPLEVASPGALSCVTNLASRFTVEGEDEASRRKALALWLTDRENPLVWRSIVNRVWHYHFGRGIVETPNDFGRMGGSPAHRGLLDWLAVTFRDDLGGSLKGLHRLILTSAVWRQGAADPLAPDRFRPLRRRMDAETFRDSVLRMAGRLDSTMGGASIKQFAMSDGIHVTPNVNYAAFDVDSAGSHRRSIYRFLFRTLPDPLMDALDSPPGDQSAPTRSESFTALQAFALLNHPFVIRQSENLAERIARLDPGTEAQIQRLVQLAYQRAPTTEETREYLAHAQRFGMANLCRLLLNSNEFHFID